jgi:hypothetical protein
LKKRARVVVPGTRRRDGTFKREHRAVARRATEGDTRRHVAGPHRRSRTGKTPSRARESGSCAEAMRVSQASVAVCERRTFFLPLKAKKRSRKSRFSSPRRVRDAVRAPSRGRTPRGFGQSVERARRTRHLERVSRDSRDISRCRSVRPRANTSRPNARRSWRRRRRRPASGATRLSGSARPRRSDASSCPPSPHDERRNWNPWCARGRSPIDPGTRSLSTSTPPPIR